MRQLSLFSDQARAAIPDDLAGLLCAQGQVHGFGRGTAARVSTVVAEQWRAVTIVRACTERALPAERGRTEEDHHWVRTAFVAGLLSLATAWTRGAVKAVPSGWQLDGAALRLWVVAAGTPDDRGYVLGLDPHAPDTYTPLAAALAAVGLAATPLGARAGGPALRISGRRRISRLAELVGESPPATPTGQWPG
ncbi:MAG TPA: hypothetical protein VNA67_03110 [Pseudonocardiaceae bacterium]|nr:hypothetical protein [Pseudonocardiaceae bacterium]